VGRLIELGRDGEAAELAIRQAAAGTDRTTHEGAVMGPLDQLDVLVPNFARLLDEVPAALDQATPCEGWAVRDLLDHVNGGARLFATAYTGEPVKERAIGDDPAPVVTEALEDFVATVRRPGALEQMVESPFGPMPGEVFARLAALDLLVHTWDLSRALGRPAGVPDDVVAAADGFARQAITPELRTPGVFGAEVTVPEGTAPLEALAAFTGRRP
jgi:uncharacterized protein (TIGR03086 family)